MLHLERDGEHPMHAVNVDVRRVGVVVLSTAEPRGVERLACGKIPIER